MGILVNDQGHTGAQVEGIAALVQARNPTKRGAGFCGFVFSDFAYFVCLFGSRLGCGSFGLVVGSLLGCRFFVGIGLASDFFVIGMACKGHCYQDTQS